MRKHFPLRWRVKLSMRKAAEMVTINNAGLFHQQGNHGILQDTYLYENTVKWSIKRTS